MRAISAALLLRMQAETAFFVWPTAKALEKLMAHSWPGNARELGNVLQRALVLREGERIEADDLHITPVPRMAVAAAADAAPVIRVPQAASLYEVEKASALDRIRTVLNEVGGHRARAARMLGISERTLRYRLAEMRELAAA